MRTHLLFVCLVSLGVACSAGDRSAAPASAPPSARELILVAPPGDSPVDLRIARLQGELRANPSDTARLERLGWAFVERARDASDPGAYHLADRCAEVLDEQEPGAAAALLLRGHVLHALHRFREAEAVAEGLVAQRGLAFDYALLGDVRMELGQLDDAVSAYQRMADLRPDAAALARIAHLRFLTGDPEGALEAMGRAVRASSPRNRAGYAWSAARLALYQLQAGDPDVALASTERALAVHPQSAAALGARGRVLLAGGQTAQAVDAFAAAVRVEPLPEALWWLAEAQQANGDHADALRTRARLEAVGEAHDRRTTALYLATSGADAERAVTLARRELEERADLYTHDALGWALVAAGRPEEARPHLARALEAGTRDARLFLHAGVAAARRGEGTEATGWLDQAAGLDAMLLPSERAALEQARAALRSLDG